MTPLVSAIIPVYNTEKYLNKCVESVLNQTIKNTQIILVDDGSTDGSPAICDEWGKKDNRIKVIHKKNEGLGYTRNAGLDVAEGEYISFLDADDQLDADTYELCIAMMEKENASACYFGRKTMDKFGDIHLNPNIPEKLVFHQKDVKEEFAAKYFGVLPTEEKEPFIQASACCVLYKRDIIETNKIRFCSEREYLSEDRFFNLDICRVAEGICILPKYCYNYTFNPVSLTKQRSNTKFERCKRMYDKLQEYAVLYPEMKDAMIRTQALFIGYTRALIKTEIEALSYTGFRECYRIIKNICLDKKVQLVYRQFPKKLLDFNSKIYVGWVKRRAVFLLMLYYMLK